MRRTKEEGKTQRPLCLLHIIFCTSSTFRFRFLKTSRVAHGFSRVTSRVRASKSLDSIGGSRVHGYRGSYMPPPCRVRAGGLCDPPPYRQSRKATEGILKQRANFCFPNFSFLLCFRKDGNQNCTKLHLVGPLHFTEPLETKDFRSGTAPFPDVRSPTSDFCPLPSGPLSALSFGTVGFICPSGTMTCAALAGEFPHSNP